MVKSKFTWWAILPLLLLLILVEAFTALGYVLWFMPNDGTLTIGLYIMLYVVLFFFLMVAYWIITEIRKRLPVVRIDSVRLIVRSFYGLGRKQKFEMHQLDGYTIMQLPVMYGTTYEYLFFIKQGKQIFAVSEFYHRNYSELKQALMGRLKFMGENSFEMEQEIKNTFQ